MRQEGAVDGTGEVTGRDEQTLRVSGCTLVKLGQYGVDGTMYVHQIGIEIHFRVAIKSDKRFCSAIAFIVNRRPRPITVTGFRAEMAPGDTTVGSRQRRWL